MATLNTVEYDANDKLAFAGSGIKVRKAPVTVDKSAAVADDDVVILARNLSANDYLLGLYAQTPGVTGMTDVDFGLASYDELSGTLTVLDADCIADGVSFASAKTGADLRGVGLTFDTTKSLAELAGKQGDSAPFGGFALIMTVNTAGAGTGTMKLDIELGALCA